MNCETFIDVERLRMPSSQIMTPSQSNSQGVKSSSKAPRIKGEFLKGPIPLDWLSRAAKLPGKAPLAVALAIKFESGRKRSDEIILTSAILQRFGVERKSKYRGLDRLEEADLIEVERRPRKNPVVRVLDAGNQQPVSKAVQGVPDQPETGSTISTSNGDTNNVCTRRYGNDAQADME